MFNDCIIIRWHYSSSSGKRYTAILQSVGCNLWKLLGHTSFLDTSFTSRFTGSLVAAIHAFSQALFDKWAKILILLWLSVLKIKHPLQLKIKTVNREFFFLYSIKNPSTKKLGRKAIAERIARSNRWKSLFRHPKSKLEQVIAYLKQWKLKVFTSKWDQ